ncbi:hypothetical protein TNCV_4616261 [Trichonephila clavipes]|nr:hypothetical protein TNCV_4616261 [Trichonephila clavipes]
MNTSPAESRHLQSVSRVGGKNSYSKELVDILIGYGDEDCNGHTTGRLKQERYPNRRVPNHTTSVIRSSLKCEQKITVLSEETGSL